jgi:hypothetical protein
MKTGYLNIILITITFFAIRCTNGQTMIPSRCYMHLTGHIGKDYELTMDLVKINDSVYADYQCRDITKNAKGNPAAPGNRGNIQVVCGKMKSDGSFSLGVPFSKERPSLIGQLLKDQKLTGTWENEEGKFPFELREKYTDGSIQFNVSSFKGSVPISKKAGSPRGTIAMAVLTPVESTNPVLSDSLKNLILGKFMKRSVMSNNPDNCLNTIKQVYFEKYLSANEELYKNKVGGPSLNWESLEFMHILYNEQHFLTFYIITYAFTGGAHGLETHEFYVVDLNTGKILTTSDIFREGYEQELTLKITQKFQDMNSLKSGQKLTDAGFFTDEVKPSDNFYLTGDGIGFFYNHYDIAPYASSPNTCFLTFSELKTLIKPGVLQSILK